MRISVTDISFGYRSGDPVLNGVSFEVSDNSITGILGSSGSGKSTLLRVIVGLLPNSPGHCVEGRVKVDGGGTMSDLRKNGRVAMMFQEPSLLPNLTVRQNVAFPLGMLRRNNGNTASKVDELLADVGLSRFKDFLPRQLSGGMQTRTALARTFVSDPDLLLLDEPFTGLDYGWKLDLYSQLMDLVARTKSTVILVSHDIQEIFLLADTILVLSKKGRVIDTRKPSQKKPSKFKPDEIALFLDSISGDIVDVQNELVREQAEGYA